MDNKAHSNIKKSTIEDFKNWNILRLSLFFDTRITSFYSIKTSKILNIFHVLISIFYMIIVG